MANEIIKQSDTIFVVGRGDVFFDKEGRTVISSKGVSAFLKEYLSNEENRFLSIGNVPKTTVINLNCPCGLLGEK
jgi:hypothetical protein